MDAGSGSGGQAPRADLMKVTRKVAICVNLVVVDGKKIRLRYNKPNA